jgi:hypothetical protein
MKLKSQMELAYFHATADGMFCASFLQAASGAICINFPRYLTELMTTLMSTGDKDCVTCIIRVLKVCHFIDLY